MLKRYFKTLKTILLTILITLFTASVFAAPIKSPLDKLFKYFKKELLN